MFRNTIRKGRYMRMTITTLAICDDALEDSHLLKDYLKKVLPEAEVKLFRGGEQLINELEKKGNIYNAIFLAIHMPGCNGIETAKTVRSYDLFVPIIFMSHSEEYYREAFDVYAFNYILKPIELKALEHILYPLKCKWGEKDERVLHFRYRSQVYTIRHNQITYISSSLHTVNFHMVDGRVIHCRGKLTDFAEQLENSTFLRCHQSFYVNMEEISAMKNDSFMLKESIIPISRSYSREAHAAYTRYLKEREN